MVAWSPALRSCSRAALKALLNWCKGEVLQQGEALYEEVGRQNTPQTPDPESLDPGS